jgi:hypothetical protein
MRLGFAIQAVGAGGKLCGWFVLVRARSHGVHGGHTECAEKGF